MKINKFLGVALSLILVVLILITSVALTNFIIIFFKIENVWYKILIYFPIFITLFFGTLYLLEKYGKKI
jgi:hypothetical protein